MTAPNVGLEIDEVIKSLRAQQAPVVLDMLPTFFVSFDSESASSFGGRRFNRNRLEKRSWNFAAKLAGVLVADAKVVAQIIARIRPKIAFCAVRTVRTFQISCSGGYIAVILQLKKRYIV